MIRSFSVTANERLAAITAKLSAQNKPLQQNAKQDEISASSDSAPTVPRKFKQFRKKDSSNSAAPSLTEGNNKAYAKKTREPRASKDFSFERNQVGIANDKVYGKNLILEDCFQAPLFDKSKESELDTDTRKQLSEFSSPLTMRQIESSLVHEFREPISATNFDDYIQVKSSYINANRMIREVVQHEYLVGEKEQKNRLGEISEFIKNETEIMFNEIESGDYKRHVDVMPKNITPKQPWTAEALNDAARILGSNPHLHPIIKSTMLGNIAKFLDSVK